MRYYVSPYRNEKLPSVTTIIGQLDKPALVYWAANNTSDYILQYLSECDTVNLDELKNVVEKARKEFRNVSRTATDIGTIVHSKIEEFLKYGSIIDEKMEDQPRKYREPILNAISAFFKWLESYDTYKTIATEQTVYGKGFAGTLDWRVLLDDVEYVIDFKTSKDIYKEYGYQIAAYATACGVEHAGVLRIDKETGMPEFKDFTENIKNDYEVFELLVKLYYKTHNWKGKLDQDF